MGLEWLSHIPGIAWLLRQLFRKLLRMYMAEEKLTETEKQRDAFKDLLVKELQEKQYWKSQAGKISGENVQRWIKALEDGIKTTVNLTYDSIESRYFLIPKNPPNLYTALLGQNPRPPNTSDWSILGEVKEEKDKPKDANK